MASIDVIAERLIYSVEALRELTPPIMHALDVIYGPVLQGALDIVDQTAVVCLHSPSGRCVYQVPSSTDPKQFYTCLAGAANWCSCLAYDYHVITCKTLSCKHCLAVRLSVALNICIDKDITEENYRAIWDALTKR